MNQIIPPSTPPSRLNLIASKAKKHARKVARKQRLNGLPAVAKLCENHNMAKSGLSVWGPYRDSPTKYRLKLSEGSGERSICFKTLEEAQATKQKILADLESKHRRTIGNLIDDYNHDLLTRRSVKPQTAQDVCAELARILPLHLSVSALTPEKAERLYADYVSRPNERTGQPRASATHQHALILAKSLFKWAVKRGHVQRNPFDGVTPMGRKSAGKPQLRIDEAHRFESTALDLAKAGDAAALGVLLMLNLGLRQGEVGARVARDVDDSGRILCVPSGKTKNASRRLRVPAHLQAMLVSLAQSKTPESFLFHDGDCAPGRQFFWAKVRAVCKLASVPRICPHSLRGLHATLALEAGATSDMVARALGHGSFEMTARHYATAESVTNARTARVTQALGNPTSPTATPNPAQLANLLNSLPAEQLAAIMSLVKAS